jgi:2-isopropylmalate synthase
MNEATRLLKESDLQIAEIADAVGYNNIQHFNRVFKEIYDISPKSFRN